MYHDFASSISEKYPQQPEIRNKENRRQAMPAGGQ